MTSSTVLDPVAFERLERIGGRDLARRMVESFLANSPTRAAAVRSGLLAGDRAAIERAAHSMTSTAANVGASRLQRAADELEAVASSGAPLQLAAAAVLDAYVEATAALERKLEEWT